MFYFQWCLARVPTLASAGLNGLFYYSLGGGALAIHGWSVAGGLLAVGMFTADCCKPEFFRGKQPLRTRLLGWVLIAGSLVAAMGLALNGRAERQAAVERVNAQIAAIDAELASLPPTGGEASIRARISTLEAAAAAESANGGCGSRCIALQREVAAAQESLGQAMLKGERASERAALERARPEFDAQALVIAEVTGVSPLIATALLAGLLAIVLEVAAVAAPLRAPARKPRVELPQYVTDLERVRALKQSGLTQAEIAAALGVSQATVSRRLNR